MHFEIFLDELRVSLLREGRNVLWVLEVYVRHDSVQAPSMLSHSTYVPHTSTHLLRDQVMDSLEKAIYLASSNDITTVTITDSGVRFGRGGAQ